MPKRASPTFAVTGWASSSPNGIDTINSHNIPASSSFGCKRSVQAVPTLKWCAYLKLSDGEIVEVGTYDDLKDHHQTERTTTIMHDLDPNH